MRRVTNKLGYVEFVQWEYDLSVVLPSRVSLTCHEAAQAGCLCLLKTLQVYAQNRRSFPDLNLLLDQLVVTAFLAEPLVVLIQYVPLSV